MTPIAESVPTPIDPSITWDRTCALLRTLAQAARKAGTTVQRFETLLRGVDWRGTGGIPC